MTIIVKSIILIIISLSAGVVISGAVFAFLTILGIVPRMAQKTKTSNYVKIYEEAFIVGGISGVIMEFLEVRIPIGNIGTIIFSLAIGMFFGAVAISLAEILDVIPILTRRLRIQKGLFFFILAIALGKLIGSLVYFIIPGFYVK